MRYWAVMGFLTRGAGAVESARDALRAALKDESPSVRVTAARALGEFGATIMFAGSIAGRTQTLPLVVYAEFQLDLETSVAAAGVLILAAAAVLIAVRLLHWRSVLDVRLQG